MIKSIIRSGWKLATPIALILPSRYNSSMARQEP
jgi:hypothetical protein